MEKMKGDEWKFYLDQKGKNIHEIKTWDHILYGKKCTQIFEVNYTAGAVLIIFGDKQAYLEITMMQNVYPSFS